MIVVCPECGATNRIPDPPEPGTRYRCGKCETRLPLAPKAPVAEDERSPTLQTAITKEKKTVRVVGTALKKISVVHPLLFAMFPILALYSYNVAEVSPSAHSMRSACRSHTEQAEGCYVSLRCPLTCRRRGPAGHVLAHQLEPLQ